MKGEKEFAVETDRAEKKDICYLKAVLL